MEITARTASLRVVFAVRIHGRGGQGVVTAAELLALAAFLEERHAQAFPSFGSERTGAPVVSFCRIDDRPIRVREPIMAPDGLIVQDPTLLHQVDVFGGMKAGSILINTGRTLGELGLGDLDGSFTILTVPATELAREHVGRPLPNAALLGGFAAMCDVVSLDAVTTAIGARFRNAVGRGNIAAAVAAHAHVERALKEERHAA